MSNLPTTDEHARTLLSSGRLAEAVDAYRRTIADRPDDFTLYNNMAECLRRLGALAEALEALNRADRLLPRHVTVALNRAALMAELGRLDEAVLVLRALQIGRNQIKRQKFVRTYGGHNRLDIDDTSLTAIHRAIASVNAQIALQK